LPSLNFIKLHGSLNWRVVEGKIFQSLDHIDEAIKLTKETKPENIEEFIDLFSIILPKKTKFKETILNQTYYDLLRVYANELDKENTLLISEGFSFIDEHILAITKRALKNPTLRLIVFCYKNSELEEYKKKFDSFNNVNIVFPKKGKINFEKFNSILDDILLINQGINK
jgi:hypothetical protein